MPLLCTRKSEHAVDDISKTCFFFNFMRSYVMRSRDVCCLCDVLQKYEESLRRTERLVTRVASKKQLLFLFCSLAKVNTRVMIYLNMFLLRFYALCVMRSRCLLSDEMFYVRIWKVFAELSVLDIFKRFRILLECARSARAEIRCI